MYNEWIAEICEAIAFHCFNTVAPRGKLAHRLPQYNGPSDDVGPSDNTNPSDTLSQASAVDDGGPFKQITLVGPNLSEAWDRNPFTRDPENICPSLNWSPSQPGGFYVYHGTAAHIKN
ncbi:hypothetical protein V8E54_013473 [Elaphomyces granulatus]